MNEDNSTITLNVAAWQERSIVNGPGERFVLWLQGCPFRCPGCFNPDFLRFVPRHLLSVAEVAELIGRVKGIEGVTYSGGEPMSQARGLYQLGQLVRARGLTVASYSGYTLAELRDLEEPWVARLLGQLDLLIDGRYDATRRANLPWRGSRNQQVHFLSDAYRHLAKWADEEGREIELIVRPDGFLSTGILDLAVLQRLEAHFKETWE